MELSKSGQHLLTQISKNYDTQHFGSQNHHTSRLIVRHDLDFSLISGLLFAEAERTLGINSQFFIRVDANSYNVNSKSSRFELMELSNFQEVGLHIDPPSSFKDLDVFKKVVAAYVDVIENFTQKPITLIEWLVKTYTNENELVLDFTAGSGTTAMACLNTNRQFIVMEKEQKYYNIILKRVEDFNKNFEPQTLFENEM